MRIAAFGIVAVLGVVVSQSAVDQVKRVTVNGIDNVAGDNPKAYHETVLAFLAKH